MTLKECIYYIKDVCKSQPNCGNVFFGDVYQLNKMENVQYPAYCITQQTHTLQYTNDFLRCRFYLFYIDRTNDSGSDELDVQSTAMETLQNILNAIMDSNDVDVNDAYTTINTFKERFNDIASGAYVDFEVLIPISDCVVYASPKQHLYAGDYISIDADGKISVIVLPDYIEQLTASLNQLIDKVNNLASGDTTPYIDSVQEIKDFLADYRDTQKLEDVLEEQKGEIESRIKDITIDDEIIKID